MNWTSLIDRQAPLLTWWQGDEIVVARGGELIDHLCLDDICRVTLVHAGAGDSPAEVRAAVFEMADRVVLLDAACGITGRVLFERQSAWAQRNCIYWVSERSIRWPQSRPVSRWPLARQPLQYQCLAADAGAALVERAQATGPHTWDQRKRFRIERRRPFPGRRLDAVPTRIGVTT